MQTHLFHTHHLYIHNLKYYAKAENFEFYKLKFYITTGTVNFVHFKLDCVANNFIVYLQEVLISSSEDESSGHKDVITVSSDNEVFYDGQDPDNQEGSRTSFNNNINSDSEFRVQLLQVHDTSFSSEPRARNSEVQPNHDDNQQSCSSNHNGEAGKLQLQELLVTSCLRNRQQAYTNFLARSLLPAWSAFFQVLHCNRF